MPTQEQTSWLNSLLTMMGGKALPLDDDGGRHASAAPGVAKPVVPPSRRTVRADGGSSPNGAQQAVGVALPTAIPLTAMQKIQPDCKPKPGFVDGPKNHVLCAVHGHVMDTTSGVIIAGSLKDYDAQHTVPRDTDADCQPIPGKMPKAPKNIVLCKHGHVVDTAKGKIVANTRTMFFRAHPEFASPVSADDIPDDPAPGPRSDPGPGPSPVPAPGPGPSPDPTPQPTPDPSVDPPPTGHELKRVFPEKVAKLKSALEGIGSAPDDAIAAEDKMRAAAKSRGIDPENTDDVSKRLGTAATGIDDNALKTLRNSRELVDSALDALRNTEIDLEEARSTVASFAGAKELQAGQFKDDAAAVKEAINNYDLAVNAEKAFFDILTSDMLGVGIAVGLLEFANADAVKDKFTDILTKMTSEQQQVEDLLNQAVTALQQVAAIDTSAAIDRIRQLLVLRSNEQQHYHTAVNNFIRDLASLPGKAGAKPSAGVKKISDTYTDILKVNTQMRNVGRQIESQSVLVDKDINAGLVPLGDFDVDASNNFTVNFAKQAKAAAALVYRQGPISVVYFVPEGIDRGKLEAMGAALEKLDSFKAEAQRMEALTSKWNTSVQSGLSL